MGKAFRTLRPWNDWRFLTGENVLNRLRDLLKGKEDSIREISFDDLPSLLDEKERAITKDLKRETEDQRPSITGAVKKIGDILDSFDTLQEGSVSHPKLEKITQSALPNFVRSMRQHINHPLSPDEEAFYQDAASILKGCITTMKGAGKYLPMVFPDEMKELRSEISVIGRSLNELTAVFSLAKKKQAQIANLRTLSQAIRSLKTEQVERKARIETLEHQAGALDNEKIKVLQSLEAFTNSDEFRLLDEEKGKLNRTENEIARLRHRKEQTLSAILSVHRRAARVARHLDNREAEKILGETIDLLESSDPDCTSIRSSIQRSGAVVLSLVGSSAITPKGQDEQRFLSSLDTTLEEAFHACADLRAAEAEARERSSRIQELPAQRKLLHQRSEQEKTNLALEQIGRDIAAEKKSWAEVPGRLESLQQKLSQEFQALFENHTLQFE